jgi:hypothetical protein
MIIFDDNSEGDYYLNWRVGLVFLCFSGLPEDGTPVTIHVGDGICHELYLTICILLYFIECVCWLIY